MNIVTVLHNKAMEFADEALIAKIEGDIEASIALFEKAFVLEKEAASSVRKGQKDDFSRITLWRSAASLAANCGKFYEANAIINRVLNENPPAVLADELKELQTQINREVNQKVGNVEIKGIIVYANVNKNEIRLKALHNNNIYSILVPEHLINEIVKSYWADVVQIKAQQMDSGAIVLDKINRAA